LLRGRILQAVAGGTGIPEISAVEVTLRDVLLERGKIGGIDIALRIAFGDPIVGVSPSSGDGHGAGIGPAGEHAENRGAVSISRRGIVAIAASQVIVHRQVGVKKSRVDREFQPCGMDRDHQLARPPTLGLLLLSRKLQLCYWGLTRLEA
jgi:hypothetical protein